MVRMSAEIRVNKPRAKNMAMRLSAMMASHANRIGAGRNENAD